MPAIHVLDVDRHQLDAAQAGGSAGWVEMPQDRTRAELIGAWIMENAVRDAQVGVQGGCVAFRSNVPS